MKKLKYFIFSLICLFSCSIVFADNEIVIKSITPVYDEQSSVEVTNENDKHTVTFDDKDQSVKYNIVIENTTDKKLKISNVNLTKPSEDIIVYELEGIEKNDTLKSNEKKELVLTIKTVSENELGEEFKEEVLAAIEFKEVSPSIIDGIISNPNTSTKGLIVLLLFATCITGASIVLYRKNKLARYVALLVAFVSIVPVVEASNIISLDIKIDVRYKCQLTEYTASTPVYKDLQKFKHWEENGKAVSTEANYTYLAKKEKALTPIYEDFIDVEPMHEATESNWNKETLTFSTTKKIEKNGWYEVGYVTEKLEKGMYIEFEIEYDTHLIWGISPSSYFEQTLEHGWAPSFEKLFVAKYNMYVVTNEGDQWLHEQPTSTTGKTKYESTSVDIASLMKNKQTLKIKYVFDDELLMYVNGVLFTSSNKIDWTINENETYNLSFTGGTASFTITDFGYDKYLTNKGNFTTPTSDPVSKDSFKNKKITFLGDSITYGVGASNTSQRYSTVLSTSLEAKENNMGASGTVLSTGGHRTSRINDINSIPLDSDYVIILLGINDFDQCRNNSSSKYYCLGDFNSTDTSTIYGSLHVYSKELIKRFREQDTKIYFMTPVITSWNNSVTSTKNWDQSKLNACGYSLPDLTGAIKEVTEYYGIVTYDLNQLSGLTSSDFSDGIHPNDNGMKKMATSIEEFLIKNYSYEN